MFAVGMSEALVDTMVDLFVENVSGFGISDTDEVLGTVVNRGADVVKKKVGLVSVLVVKDTV